MQNLLVTGGSGFIGSNFIRYLLTRTSYAGRVINLDKLTYAGNPENLQDITNDFSNRYVFEHEDICNPDAIERIFNQYKIDAVCHFAAESHVDRSITSPEAFIDTNIKGTFNLLEAARKQGEKFALFHHISTDEVYGSLGKTGRFTETTSYSPNSPYSASKASSDHLVRAYYETYDLPVTISNCSNNYGPYQFPEKLIPLITLNALEGKFLPIYGDGSNVRDWLFVEDHCRAVWLIMEKGLRGETYNIGGGEEMDNRTLVEMICDILDKTGCSSFKEGSCKKLIKYVKDRPGHDFRYAIDSSKIITQLGWVPDESFASGLEKTVLWYINHPEWILRILTGEYLNWIETQYV